VINLCTLFNSNYLSRGLALYKSLSETCPNFHLYVFAFDDQCHNFLQQQNYQHLTAIALKDFEDDELLTVKPSRSPAEYCWTCTPSTILYCIKKFQLPSCTYIDADIIFYSNPAVLIEEMGNDSVLISEHRYTKLYDQSLDSGIYCVQFMRFKNTEHGMKVLQWWRNTCLEWCYARIEDGKFGDQKYLDDWPSKFEGVHVLQHLGGGIAPWNVQQYGFEKNNGKLMLIHKVNKKKYPVVFFHFHGLKFYEKNIVECTKALYELDKLVKELFYIPYIRRLTQVSTELSKHIQFDPNGATGKAPSRVFIFITYLKNFIFALKNDPSAIVQLKNYNFKKHFHYWKLNKLIHHH